MEVYQIRGDVSMYIVQFIITIKIIIIIVIIVLIIIQSNNSNNILFIHSKYIFTSCYILLFVYCINNDHDMQFK